MMPQRNGLYFELGLTQPIKWRKWSQSIFRLAARLDKPVFLNIGAAWSRWCSEMDSKVFSDGSLANHLNANYVCVRVDRDEQPNVDRVFQSFVGGGYPVNCVLTPDGRVVVAANFLPLQGSAGEAGLMGLLTRVSELWKSDRQSLLKGARALGQGLSDDQPVRLTPALVDECVVRLLMEYDWELGGVGLGQQRRFPQPTVNRLLLMYAARTGDTLGVQSSSITLRKMYYGGIMDQVGGGFHRNADAEWLVPSFEKLLVDNAEAALNYAYQYMATSDEEFLDALNFTLGFMESELVVEGGFAVSLASDGEREGEYYTWTPQEVNEALGQTLGEAARRLFGIHPIVISADPYSATRETTRGVVAGRIVPRRTLDISEFASMLGVDVRQAWKTLNEIRSKMKAYRDAKKGKPKRDDALYTYPNMLAAESALIGYVVTGGTHDVLLKKALEVLGGIKSKVYRRLDGGREGLAEDYGSSLNALLMAYEVTGDPRFLESSMVVASRLKGFVAADGFRDELRGKASTLSKLDSPNESPASLCLRGVLRLCAITGDEYWLTTIGSLLPNILKGLNKYKEVFVSGVYSGLDMFMNGATHVVVVDAGDGVADTLHRAAMVAYNPFKVVERVMVDRLSDHPNPFVRGLPRDKRTKVYVRKGWRSNFTASEDSVEGVLGHLKIALHGQYNY
ncbi:MAG: DUF255 domain-containing protein [Thermoprotei archaeon]